MFSKKTKTNIFLSCTRLSSFHLYAVLCVSILIGLSTPLQKSHAGEVNVLYQKGELFLQQGESSIAIKAKKLDAANTLKIDTAESVDNKSIEKNPEILKEAYVALAYSEREVITISKNSTISQTSQEGQSAAYKLSGVGHILIDADANKSPFKLQINDLQFQIQKAHIFFNGIKETHEITIVEGREVSIIKSNQAILPSTPDAKPVTPSEEVPLKLEKGDCLAFETDNLTLLKKVPAEQDKKVPAEQDKILENSIVPGFSTPGPYKVVGSIKFDKPPLIITRFEKKWEFPGEDAPVMEKDKVETSAKQIAVLTTIADDEIRIFEKSRFSVDELIPKKEKKPSFVASLWGKVRSVIKPRKEKGSIKYRAPTAIVGVKGTDFEIGATDDSSEVLTIEGIVGVADANGEGEVDLTAGMMSTIAAGQAPSEPAPIPPERLDQMKKESTQLGQAPSEPEITPAESIRILSPTSGQSLREAVAEIEIEPDDGAYEVFIDGSPFQLDPSTKVTLSNLDEGQHYVFARSSDGNVLESVNFFVDKTPPSLKSPKNAQKIEIEQGKTVELLWSEPLEKVESTLNLQPWEVNLSEDKRSIILNGDNEKLTTSIRIYQITVEDAAGNKTTIQGQISVKKRVKAIKILSPKAGEILQQGTIQVTVDPPDALYQVLLDDKPVELNPLQPTPLSPELGEGIHRLIVNSNDGKLIQSVVFHKKKLAKTIEILSPKAKAIIQKGTIQLKVTPPDAPYQALLDNLPLKIEAEKPTPLPQLNDGPHNLIVHSNDGKLIQSIIFYIDKTPPILQTSKDLQTLVLGENETLELRWDGEIYNVKALLGDSPWNLSSTKDGNGVVLKGDRGQLTPESKPFEITVEDAAGNQNSVKGNIRLKLKPKPKKKPASLKLNVTCKESMMHNTGYALDAQYLGNCQR